MTISKIRGVLYKTARTLGDVQAVENGKIIQRIERRIVGRFLGRLMGRLFR